MKKKQWIDRVAMRAERERKEIEMQRKATKRIFDGMFAAIDADVTATENRLRAAYFAK